MARRGGSISASDEGRARAAYTVRARIEGVEKTSDEFKQARREFNAAMRDVMVEAGEKAVLPEIRAQFPSRRWGATLYVKRDRTTVFIGSKLRGKLNRALGWLDFGGRRPRDRRRRKGPHVIVTVLGHRREYIDDAVLAGLLRTFSPLETSL
jgi:hypothetical protein